MLTLARLEYLLDYNPNTGIVTWRVPTSNRVKAGSRAGVNKLKRHRNGTSFSRCRTLSIDGVSYQEHRLIWFYMTGEWPKGKVDHIDRDGWNNRWKNLRTADVGQNRANSKVAWGTRGVRHIPSRKKPYHARLIFRGVMYSLGYHSTFEEAKRAHDDRARELWGEYFPEDV